MIFQDGLAYVKEDGNCKTDIAAKRVYNFCTISWWQLDDK